MDIKDRLFAYLRRNSDRLYIILALFIFAEGVVLLEYTRYWWIPLLSLPVCAICILLWKNHKVVIKFIISMVFILIASAFSMLSATSFSNSSSSGLLAPAGIITGSLLFILCSYFYDTNASRWTALQISVILAFIASYSMLVFGSMAMMITSIITMLIVGSLWMLLSNAWNRRSSGMPVRPRSIPSYMTSKLSNALGKDWIVETSDSKYPFHVARKNDDDRLFVFIPLEFSTHIYMHRRKGLVYRNRRIGEYLYKVLAYARHRTHENAVILIEDWSGTSESYEDIAIPISDSQSAHEYTRIIDMSQSPQTIRNDIQDIMMTFDYKGISDKKSSYIMNALSSTNNNGKRDNK